MKTLLEISYIQCKNLKIFPESENLKFIRNLTYQNVKEGEEKDIYDKIVDLSRIKIRKALRKNMRSLILKTIYLLKTTNVSETAQQIIGDFNNYKGSLWRLSMLHAVASFIYSKTDNERILDILHTCDKYLPYDNVIERKNITDKIFLLTEDADIFQYISIYYSFGSFLFP